MKPLAPNVLIQNRYLIVHLIGKGGMGEVYLAVDQRLGSAVALKRTFFSDDDMLASAFEREARILANLRHPILPKVSDHFVEGENQFLVMEHITGDDLSKRLEKTQQSFPLSWVLFWADQLLDALNYLHTHEPPIIHRDIKPQNLKLTNENHIVLLDFGLSKNSPGETKASSTGSVVGYTPHYAPMEQIRGTGTNAQSDLYSLSATVYQLLTNNVPPDALTRADSLLSGLPDPITPINELNKEVSPEVSNVVIKGMDIRQESRYSSAREMQKALRDAYSRLQSAMLAQTATFNINDQDVGTNKELLEQNVQFKTQIVEPQGQSNSAAASSDYRSEKSGNFPNSAGRNSNENIEVLPEVSLNNGHIKPSDIKTEILLSGSSPAIQAAQEDREIPLGGEAQELEELSGNDDFAAEENSSNEDFLTKANFTENEVFSSNGKIPLFSSEESEEDFLEEDIFGDVGGHGETEFFSNIEPNEPDVNATFVPRRESSNVEKVNFVPKPKTSSAPVKKQKGSKFALVGGLLALLVLVVGGVGGIAWVVMNDKSSVGRENSLPTPEASIEVTPSVEPTRIESSIEGNTNNETVSIDVNSNNQVSEVNKNISTNINKKVDISPSTPTKQITTKLPVISPPTKLQPAPDKSVVIKKVPTPTPKPGGILQ